MAAGRLILSYYTFVMAMLWLADTSSMNESRQSTSAETLLVYRLPCEESPADIIDSCNDTLESIATNLSPGSDVYIDIYVTTLDLKRTITFKNLRSLSINGSQNTSTKIMCLQMSLNIGIVIEGIENVSLTNLKVEACGTYFKFIGKKYTSALLMRNCTYVSINHVSVTDNKGIGLTIRRHCKGVISVFRSNFSGNNLPPELRVRGGGGIFIGDFTCTVSNQSVEFRFEECYIGRNIAKTREFPAYYANEFGEQRGGYGVGGGVFMSFENDLILVNVTVTFSQCSFIGNKGYLGSGLSVKVGRGRKKTDIASIKIVVKDSEFLSNGYEHHNASFGGGVYLRFDSAESSSKSDSEYIFNNVRFIGNRADLGGSVFIYSKSNTSNANVVLFCNCTFENNEAHTGSAVDLHPSNFINPSDKHNTKVTFNQCSFIHNSVYSVTRGSNSLIVDGTAAVYANHHGVNFVGNNTFLHNNGTALYMVNSMADFHDSSATFIGNMGARGGAISLIGTSIMLVGPKKEYLFVNNTAIFQGGAIFVSLVSNHDFTLSKSCFIQYFDGKNFVLKKDHWDIVANFTGNKAQTGSAIFATSLHPCQTINNATTEKNMFYASIDASEIFSIRNINVDNSEVTTDGANLQVQQKDLRVIPGRWFWHNVEITDDLKVSIKAPLRASIQNSTSLKLGPEMSPYVGDKIQLQGEENSTATLYLRTASNRMGYVKLNVQLEECPPGFTLENKVCNCKFSKYYGLIKCTEDYQTVLTTGLWAGKIVNTIINTSELVTGICPRKFCNYKNSFNSTFAGIILPRRNDDLEEAMCGKVRKGILCGECTAGYTTYYHSPTFQCEPVRRTLCKVGWLFYIVSELVPVTVVFITVLALNISFTSGAVNGFILFSQILLTLNIDASGIVTFSYQRAVTESYRFLYGFFNLDFFTTESLSFCLWTNASALDMLAFKYVTIVYALSLVVLVIWFMNKCGGRCLGQCCRFTALKSSIIHGISAFFIICYSQSMTVSSALLSSAELWQKHGSKFVISRKVWHNGNIDFFSSSHLPYAIPALLCIALIGVLPPVLLLAYPSFNKLLSFAGLEDSRAISTLSRVFPVGSLKPVLDSFQGCFKDDMRFFAGLYFVYRWIAPTINSATSSLGTTYVTSEFFLFSMLLLHALFQPYTHRLHNVIDTLLFANLFLINSLTCIHFYLFLSQESHKQIHKIVEITAAAQMTLIYLPILIAILSLLTVVCKHINIRSQMTQLLRRLSSGALQSSTDSSCGGTNDAELPYRMLENEIGYELHEDSCNVAESNVFENDSAY